MNKIIELQQIEINFVSGGNEKDNANKIKLIEGFANKLVSPIMTMWLLTTAALTGILAAVSAEEMEAKHIKHTLRMNTLLGDW